MFFERKNLLLSVLWEEEVDKSNSYDLENTDVVQADDVAQTLSGRSLISRENILG